ncbi:MULTISPECIES: hypothetical protein [unclassified Paenibacillus]|uniref:hypothetical protein n=1 Tax=unclassified Paenibacillus TaxID=185978 RepID=UPI0015C5EFB8|nr:MULTISPECIES: hypothetical protein [unclassified Paenibacillus]MBY3621351.1 hypothetical protein [Acinetobacter sp. CUI P1]MDH6373043.1 hypothetical protein [Paenibacillus sp. PastF-3]
MQNKKRNSKPPVSPRELDKLALISAILLLMAAVIGLYIAWVTLKYPNSSSELVI